MIKFNEKIKSLLVLAIKKTKAELDEKYKDDKLFGYALCTDDAVMTIYHVACTNSWVKEQDDKYMIYSSVEWGQSGENSHFEKAYDEIYKDYENSDHEDGSFEINSDMRFEAMVQALKECKEEAIFDEDTILSVASTDPSEESQFLQMRGIDRLNSPKLANEMASVLGIEKYRE